MRRLAIIGVGNMGSAVIRGILASGLLKPAGIMAADASPTRLTAIRRYGVRTTTDDRQAATWSDTLILTVKPRDIDVVLREIRPSLSARHLLISVLAGVPLRRIRQLAGPKPRLIRALPNLPAFVGAAMTAVAPEPAKSGRPGTPTAGVETTQRLFEAVGRVVVVEERLLDAVTGLSGSGPAYVCLVVEALVDGGVKMGLSRALALLLAVQTVFGAARLLAEQGESPEEVIKQVASPGGTTIAGLRVLERGRVKPHLTMAVVAAAKRSRQLGGR